MIDKILKFLGIYEKVKEQKKVCDLPLVRISKYLVDQDIKHNRDITKSATQLLTVLTLYTPPGTKEYEKEVEMEIEKTIKLLGSRRNLQKFSEHLIWR